MSVASAVARGRRAASQRMTSRCTIRRKAAGTSQNESTGLVAPTWTATYTGLPIRVAGVYGGAAGSRTLDIAGVQPQEATRVAHLPHDTDNLADGDLIEVTSGDTAGLVLRIIEADWQDQATARRVAVIAVDRPGEW